MQYAENPPKKYQDIFPLEFETEQWELLWQELRSVILYWTEQDVRIAISGNLCRCTGYQGIVAAALDAAKRLGGRAGRPPS